MILSHEWCKTQYPHILRQKLQTTSNRKRVAENSKRLQRNTKWWRKVSKKLLILILNAGTNICFPANTKKGTHLHIFRRSQRSPKTRPPNVDQLCLLSSPEISSSELQTAMARFCAVFMSWLTCSSRPDWWSFTLVSKENVQRLECVKIRGPIHWGSSLSS